jgi:hypothetical protein
MESIKKTWEMSSLEVNGGLMIGGYITALVMLVLTYMRLF